MHAKRWSRSGAIITTMMVAFVLFATSFTRAATVPFSNSTLHRARLKVRWQMPLGLGVRTHDRIAHVWLLGKSVFVLTRYGYLICLNASSGSIRWTQQYAVRGQATLEPVNYGKKHLLIIAGSKLLVVSKADGSVTKSQALKFAPSTRPVISNGRMFIGSYHNRMYALSPHIPLFMHWAQYSSGDAFLSRPVVLDGMLVCGSQNGHVWGHLATDGSGGWRRTLSGAVDANLGTDGHRVFVPCLNHNLYAINASTGIAPWITRLPGRLDHQPVMFGKRLMICTGGAGLISLNPASGVIQWGPVSRVKRIVGKIGHRIAAAGRNGLLIISPADGAVIYTAVASAPCVYAKSTVSKRIYVASTNGFLMALVRRYPLD
jgi:outer membrane protein assembly factor BamB